ncbi:DMT family transporter [Kaustia mangrovi]|uniref:DMT family transporter n=1 Tax=Kaustia mangrovi TaxID=2593653 RepID=A0A7S8C2A7_9HYPH|nr:DMT family transporter [Kaustia mangrovi]QPC42066.1 DMT family transporter [Kaustia mangrovi]
MADRDKRRIQIAFALLLLGAAAVALSPILVRVSEIGPTATAFYRVAFALPGMWAVAMARRRGGVSVPTTRRQRLVLGLAGALFAGDLALWHSSLDFTLVANATLFANAAPIFVTLVAWLVFGERMTLGFLAGLAVTIVGAGVLTGESMALDPSYALGDAMALGAGAFYGGYILAVSRLRARFTTLDIMMWGSLGSAIVLLPLTLAMGESLLPETAEGWAVLVALGLVSHAGGQGLVAYALAHLPVSLSSVSLLLEPVLAAGFAWVLFGEMLGPVQIAGGLIVLLGVLWCRYASLKRRAVSPQAQ